MFDIVNWWRIRTERREEQRVQKRVQVAQPVKKSAPRRDYQRRTRYRNWMNQRVWLPVFKGGFAYLSKNRVYEVRENGWRRIKQEGESA